MSLIIKIRFKTRIEFREFFTLSLRHTRSERGWTTVKCENGNCQSKSSLFLFRMSHKMTFNVGFRALLRDNEMSTFGVKRRKVIKILFIECFYIFIFKFASSSHCHGPGADMKFSIFKSLSTQPFYAPGWGAVSHVVTLLCEDQKFTIHEHFNDYPLDIWRSD